MNVTVAESDKLKRKLSVEVPLSEVRTAYNDVFAKLQTNVRVNGFRPGKFPRHLAEKRFKEAMAGEALQNLVPKYYQQALEELKLRPATEPKFDNLDIDKTKPLKFDVELEIIPDFDLLPPSAFKLKEKKAKVTAKDVDGQIEELRGARAALEDKGKPAAKGDVVTFDFRGTIDGEVFDGGSGEDQRIELGASQYLPDFDAQFHGIEDGETKTFQMTFPEDYGTPQIAGKEVHFEITAKKVAFKVPPPLDKDFFAQFGEHETEKDFKDSIKAQLENDRERKVREEYSNELIGQIKKNYHFDVPQGLVEQGIDDYEHRLSHDDPETLQDGKKLEKLKKEERGNIESNLRLAYVVGAIANENGIMPDETEVKERFYYQAYMMGMNPTEIAGQEMGRRMVMQIEQNLITSQSLALLSEQVIEQGRGGEAKSGAVSKSESGAKAKSGAVSKSESGAKAKTGAKSKDGAKAKTGAKAADKTVANSAAKK